METLYVPVDRKGRLVLAHISKRSEAQARENMLRGGYREFTIVEYAPKASY